jgi:tetratricopeptide (TPR) repeat protein
VTLAMSWAAVIFATSLGVMGPAPAPTSDPAAASTKARAKESFRAGKAAAAEARWHDAIEHFERALALRRAASLHYNIAVCHHNLMLEARDDPKAHEQHRQHAVDAYAEYLAQSPDAEDRASVERAIEELGGRPDADAWVIERIEPDDAPAALALHDDDDGDPDPSASGPTPPRGPQPSSDFPLGRVGPFVPLVIANPLDLSRSNTMRLLPSIGLGVRGGAFVTRSRHLNVGGELWFTGQPVSLDRDVALLTGGLSFVAEYAYPIAENRVELGGGAGLGVALQSLRYRGDTTVPCPLSGKALSTRGGLLAAARLVVSGLLGARRQHELSLRLTPSVAFYGRANKGSDDAMMCDEQPHGFESVGLERRAALVMMIDLGYALRL